MKKELDEWEVMFGSLSGVFDVFDYFCSTKKIECNNFDWNNEVLCEEAFNYVFVENNVTNFDGYSKRFVVGFLKALCELHCNDWWCENLE